MRRPAAVLAQNVLVLNASCVADAIEEFQNLNGPFTAEPDRVSVARGIHAASFVSQRGDHAGERVDAIAVVEQVMHDLTDGSASDLLAKNLPHAIFGLFDGRG